MKNNYPSWTVLIATSFLTMGMQCFKDFPIAPPTYEFAEKMSLYPYKKKYTINDTIWVEFRTTDKSLYDKLSRRRINTDTTSFTQFFYYHKRFPSSSLGDIFCSTVIQGGVNPVFETPIWYNTLRLESECSSGHYFFKVGFIPKTTGIYSIELPGNLGLRTCPGRLSSINCIYGFTFNLADCNKDVYLSIPPQSRSGEQGFIDVKIDKKEIFVFEVG
jgi:hypothetical protein